MLSRIILSIGALFPTLAVAQPLTLPSDSRPDWLRRDGIVMAGSWEPLLFRVRRDGSPGYTPTPEQRAAYDREHSPEMVAQLKALGVNFVMMHCYKGFGLQAERESMADAVKFAKLCHDAGLRVGVYNYSGAFGWELFFKEVPEAEQWVVLNAKGKPTTYGGATPRYYWNRNHPDAQAFYKNLIRFSVNDIKTDLVHLDNYSFGPGSDKNSVQRFRDYLRDTFTPAQREQMGITDLAAVKPPMTGPPDNLLRRAWLDFSCRSMADSYHDMSRYARSLRPDILMECNPGGVLARIRPPVNHGLLLTGGEAFWDEGKSPGLSDGKLTTRIRTYKVGRRMNNMVFAYTTNPLEMAESMAFNLDCLGCICWFEYARVLLRPREKGLVSKDVPPYIRFFHQRRDLLRDAAVVADVAVLRSASSQLFADTRCADLTAQVEAALIENRVPFQILYDSCLDDLKGYRAIILAGCPALSDAQIDRLSRYAAAGGKLLLVGPAATHDQWMIPRPKPALADLPVDRVLRVSETDPVLDAVRRICGDKLSLSIDAPLGLCAELTDQPNRRLVHLVNYRSDQPAKDVPVRLLLPPGRKVESVALAGPLRDADAQLPFKQDAQLVTFSVPRIDTYELAIVNCRSSS